MKYGAIQEHTHYKTPRFGWGVKFILVPCVMLLLTVQLCMQQTQAFSLRNKTQSNEEAQPSPKGSRLNIIPFFVTGQTVSLSVQDISGTQSAGASISINDENLNTDEKGFASFTVADTEHIEIALLGADKRKEERRRFKRRADGYFAESELVAEEASALAKIPDASARFPSIVFSPAVIAPGDNFIIVGNNFSNRAPEDHVDIDGMEAKVLSASTNALLVEAPSKLRIGPIRELSLIVSGQASNTCEADVARAFFNHIKTEDDDVSPEKGKIGMNGSNVPCLVEVRNDDLETVSLWSPEPLGKQNVLLTPGGDQNYLPVDVKLSRPNAEPRIMLTLRSELDAAKDADSIPPQMRHAAEKAEIIRLERRRIAAEYRLQDIRKKVAEDGADQERLLAEAHALTLRMQHLSRMQIARRAIFECLGGTDAQYRQALDDAAGGALISLDLSVKPIQVINGSESRASEGAQEKKGGRSLRLLEPPIKLLPPMTPEEEKIALARQAASKDNEPEPESESGLRPSLPEEAPASSAESRSTAGSQPATISPSKASGPKAKQTKAKGTEPKAKNVPSKSAKKQAHSKNALPSAKSGRSRTKAHQAQNPKHSAVPKSTRSKTRGHRRRK